MPNSDIFLKNAVGCAFALSVLIAGRLFVRLTPGSLSRLASCVQRLSGRTRVWIVLTLFLPVLWRIAFLPWVPQPYPNVQDEFGHLLVADTLLHARLANPPHPLARHLETVYVLQRPAYASIYPIGMGAVLAVGQLVGRTPWAGILMAAGVMCGAITWMLYACVPPPWAAVGGLLSVALYGISTPWIDTYMGGALTAFGGALAFGALARLRKRTSARMTVVLSVGWSIVCLVRPFESIFLLLVLAGGVAMIMSSGGNRRAWLRPMGAAAAVFAITACIIAIHNRAVSGSVWTLPYVLAQRQYGVPQTFIGLAAKPNPRGLIQEQVQIYDAQRKMKDSAERSPVAHLFNAAKTVLASYVKIWLMLPFFAGVLSLRRHRIFAIAVLAGAVVTEALYPWFLPHYLAAYSCLFVFVAMAGLIRLSNLSLADRKLGAPLVAFCVLATAGVALAAEPLRMIHGIKPEPRQIVERSLTELGGTHVVFVRYGPTKPHDDWVYNDADIDGSKIVWVRATTPAEEAEVVRYYAGRRFWVAEVEDLNTFRLASYPSPPGPTTFVAESR